MTCVDELPCNLLTSAFPALASGSVSTDFFPTHNRHLSANADPLSWGDSMYSHPGAHLRIYFQNIDGLRNDTDEIDLYIASVSQLHIGTFCWADPGLDFFQFHIRHKLKSPLRYYFTAAKSAFSSSSLPKEASTASSGYQPGEPLWRLQTTGQLVASVTNYSIPQASVDGPVSRISERRKTARNSHSLSKPPRQQPNGGFGFFDQQYSLLLSQGVKTPNVRRQFIVDISEFINSLQQDGHEILLSLDANKTLGHDRTYGIEHLTSACSLSDLHFLGPESPQQPTNTAQTAKSTSCSGLPTSGKAS